MDAHAPGRHAARREHLPDEVLVVGVGHVEVHGLVRGDGADHPGDVLDGAMVERPGTKCLRGAAS